MSLAVMVPTRGRPENAARLAEAVYATAGQQLTAVYFLCDPGEPRWADYHALLSGIVHVDAPPWVYWEVVAAVPQRIGPILNKTGPELAERYEHVAFMGDDHLPRTPRWDEELVRALGGKPGVAYGNDLLQGENLPTMAVLSSDLVRGLGFFVPRTLEHLYLDDFWRLLGQSVGNLAYRGDVVIEHLHPLAGKAADDPVYQAANSAGQKQRDGEEFARYQVLQWEADLHRLKEYLGG
jgi:hypothetical protein